MERSECEKAIEKKLREIVDIYHEYNPDGEYLSLTYCNEDGDGWCQINNSYWPGGEDAERQICISTLAPLVIVEKPFAPGMVRKIVTGFSGEEIEEINKLYFCGEKEEAQERALEVLDKRNGKLGTCWHNGYGIYGFALGEGGCIFKIGTSCD